MDNHFKNMNQQQYEEAMAEIADPAKLHLRTDTAMEIRDAVVKVINEISKSHGPDPMLAAVIASGLSLALDELDVSHPKVELLLTMTRAMR